MRRENSPSPDAQRPTPFAAYAATDLSAHEKLLLNAYAVQMRAKGESRFDSVERLAALCALSVRTVQAVRASLIKKGYLLAEKRPGRSWLIALGQKFFDVCARLNPRSSCTPSPANESEAPPQTVHPNVENENQENLIKNIAFRPRGEAAAAEKAIGGLRKPPRGAVRQTAGALHVLCKPAELERYGGFKRADALAGMMLRLHDFAVIKRWAEMLVRTGQAGCLPLSNPRAVLGSLAAFDEGEQRKRA